MTRPGTSFCYLLILAIAPTLALAAPKAIQRRAYVRKGPGPYYDLVLKLSAGDVVTKAASNKQWIRITAKQGSGWVVDKAFVKPKARVDYSGMLADPGMKKAYSVDIAAATKGAFLTTYSNKKDMNVDVAIMVDKSRINVQLVPICRTG